MRKKGLSRKHHGELNALTARRGRHDELREQYAGDDLAQEQIDVYDPETEYHDHIEALVRAVEAGDEKAESRQDRWFRKHYPLVSKGRN